MKSANAYKLILSLLMLLSSSASAEIRWVEVTLPTVKPLSEVTGVLFSNDGAQVAADARVSMTTDNLTIAAISYDSEHSGRESLYAYAIGVTEENETVFSDVQSTSPEFNKASGFAQGACIPDDVPASMQSQLSLIANLLKIRDKRRANLRTQINTKLSGDFLDKLQRYEKGAGLTYGSPLSPDMPAATIVDRLDRLLHTLRKFPSKG